ncbi:NAD-dependent epimerase/dehydratase family protein [Synechococcus lacustris]|uniref:NAD-dependent epimerase/dehydratase family protein n=1 Tax=Synechococcus lacustris TaxID=2116544 RepID=UPI0020CD16E5|nr:NAD-dependent epimerase/dehydratase family protein [Synechococcus lacustris]
MKSGFWPHAHSQHVQPWSADPSGNNLVHLWTKREASADDSTDHPRRLHLCGRPPRHGGQRWFSEHKPTVVVLAAAKVGGIQANSTYPADFLLDNLKIQTNVIEMAWRSGVRRLLFLGSSCIYPKLAEQPIREEALLTGALEPTNEWYAIAKITGIKLCEALRRQHGFDAISL